jgi:archaellum biogenesis ATPase FlaH
LFDENPTSDQKVADNTEKMDNEVSQDLRDLIERNDRYRLIPTLILTEYEILSKREQNERERLLQQMLTQAQEISATKQVIIDSQEKLIADYEKEIDDYVKVIEDLKKKITELQKLSMDIPVPAKQT